MITHTWETSYQCNFCKKKFPRKDDLTRHMITHTGETYQCFLCKNKFSRKDKLLKLMRTHTGTQNINEVFVTKILWHLMNFRYTWKYIMGRKKEQRREFTSSTKKTLPNKGLKRGPLKQKKIDSKSSRKMWEIVGWLGAFAVTERCLLLPVNIIMAASKNWRQS